jgi:K+-sensing histidine kinase KdpD
MRNPLSAIMQCADGILDSYTAEISVPPSPGPWSTFLEQTLDAAQTISQCAMHMRHIVDDILTISKLDSGLLMITPVDAQPESIVKHAIKMFDAEAKAAGVKLSHVIDASYRDMLIDFCSLDSTRVLQVSTNLLVSTYPGATQHTLKDACYTEMPPAFLVLLQGFVLRLFVHTDSSLSLVFLNSLTSCATRCSSIFLQMPSNSRA